MQSTTELRQYAVEWTPVPEPSTAALSLIRTGDDRRATMSESLLLIVATNSAARVAAP